MAKPTTETQAIVISTSTEGWLAELARAYKEKRHVILRDDAKVGVNPSEDSLIAMGKKAALNPREWTAVAVSVGVAATGAYLVIMAILDPEPFSKIGFALGAGAVLTMTGGFLAVRVLTGQTPPHVRVTKAGFDISWDD